MNKYLDYIEKQAGLMEIPSSLFRVAGKGITKATKGIGHLGNVAAGSEYRDYVNKTAFGGKATIQDLHKINNTSAAYRKVLQHHRAVLKSQGHKGPLFARGTRTETYGSLTEKARKEASNKGLLFRDGDLKVSPEKGHRFIEDRLQPEKNMFKTLKKDQLDAKVALGTIGVAGIYGGNKLHNKIRDKLRGPDQNQYTYSQY